MTHHDDDFEVKHHSNGGVTVTHIPSGVAVTKKGCPVASMNADAAFAELDELLR